MALEKREVVRQATGTETEKLEAAQQATGTALEKLEAVQQATGMALEKMKKEAAFEECMDTSFGGELAKLEEL